MIGMLRSCQKMTVHSTGLNLMRDRIIRCSNGTPTLIALGNYHTPSWTPTPGPSGTGSRLGLFRTPAGSRLIRRKILLVDLEAEALVSNRSTFVNLSDGEFDVTNVARKVAESVNSDEVFVLLDSKNQEMTDCPVTQGKEFWQSSTRVVKACQDFIYQEYLEMKCPRKRKPVRKETLDDITDRIHTLMKLTEPIRNVMSVGKAAVLIPVEKGQGRKITESLTCIICKGPIKKPVVSSCCKSLVGCRRCFDEWYGTSAKCPKCNSDDGRAGRINLCGLDDTFELLWPLLSTDEENI